MIVVDYNKASDIAREIFGTNKTIKQVIMEKEILSENEVDKILNPENMI
ncbi:MAG: hypothetical protein DRP84_06700 [Spirochaetes bacterium]|nr:MAG: hypothetical protein DRP84_06700 [Spirochaetota bacterium]RKY02091.1 MAG: hypothetical protein DRP55_03360 [Spirochaetota bacterium]